MNDLFQMSRELSLGKKVKIRFPIYEPIHEEMIFTLLGQVLSNLHLNYLETILATIINELINNASKANIKRVFFKKSRLDINQSQDYHSLITKFKEEAVVKLRSYREDLIEEGLFIEFCLQLKNSGTEILIRNNSPMTPEEESRVNIRLSNAYALRSMTEAFDTFSDDDEGAGLGIVLNVQLLKNANIPAENFQIRSDGEFTYASLVIPSSIKSPDKLQIIHEKIMEEILELPIFSSNIQNLLDLTSDSHSSLEEIIVLLNSDPGLCSELIREAVIRNNHSKSFDSLLEACAVLGKSGIYQVISTCGSRRIMESRYKDFHKFWIQSIRCGYYVRSIADRLNLDVSMDRLYLAGIFHNLGKLIIFSLQPTMQNALVNTTMEEIQMGVSNAQVGSMVAEKWGYSKELVSLLKNYLRPMASPDNLKLETSVLHVADYMIKTLGSYENFIYLDVHAIQLLGFHSKLSVLDLRKELDEDFEEIDLSLR